MLYFIDAWLGQRVPVFTEERFFDEDKIFSFLGLPDYVHETDIATPNDLITVFSRGDHASTRKVKIAGSLFRLPVAITSKLPPLEVSRMITYF